MKVDHYGLIDISCQAHQHDGLTPRWALVEQDGLARLLSEGGAEEPRRVEVRLTTGDQICGHALGLSRSTVPASAWQAFERRLAHEPLVGLMLPLPKRPRAPDVIYVHDEAMAEAEYLATLLRATSPVKVKHCLTPVEELCRLGVEHAIRELSRSNVQPLVAIDAHARHAEFLRSLLDAGAATMPRRLILAGDPDLDLPGVSRYRRHVPADERMDLVELIMMPWEAIGATVLGRFATGQWDIDVEKPISEFATASS